MTPNHAGSRQIVCQDDDGHWSAWFEDQPHTAFGGPESRTAVARLLEAYGLHLERCSLESQEPFLERFAYRTAAVPCPDCGGTGRYIGLSAVEDCLRCVGHGMV